MLWKKLHKIGVTGSRRFENPDLVTMFLMQYIRENYESTEDVIIITGSAVGVDAAVELWCMKNGIKNLIIPARWLELEPKVGKNPAGLRRNHHIVDLSNEVFAFWDGSSPGTAHCMKLARKANKLTKIFSIKELRKELGIKPPVKIKLPPAPITDDVHRFPTSVKTAKKERYLKKSLGRDKLSDLIKEAGLENFFTGEKMKGKRKKEYYI